MESLINIDIPRMSSRDCRQKKACLEEVEKRSKLDLDNYDYWFIPVINPDGYEYTQTTDRLWRKTRSVNFFCEGVDPNRNYPFHWRESGASQFPCSEIYAGPRPLSEPETAALTSVLDANKERIVMYLSLHAYSQYILAPYGYGRVYPDNYAELERVANQWIRSVSRLRGTKYEFGTSAIKLYPAAGGSDDYAHGKANIRLAYTIELPDTGNYGFVLPPSEIIPVGQETLIGIRAMVDAIKI